MNRYLARCVQTPQLSKFVTLFANFTIEAISCA